MDDILAIAGKIVAEDAAQEAQKDAGPVNPIMAARFAEAQAKRAATEQKPQPEKPAADAWSAAPVNALRKEIRDAYARTHGGRSLSTDDNRLLGGYLSLLEETRTQGRDTSEVIEQLHGFADGYIAQSNALLEKLYQEPAVVSPPEKAAAPAAAVPDTADTKAPVPPPAPAGETVAPAPVEAATAPVTAEKKEQTPPDKTDELFRNYYHGEIYSQLIDRYGPTKIPAEITAELNRLRETSGGSLDELKKGYDALGSKIDAEPMTAWESKQKLNAVVNQLRDEMLKAEGALHTEEAAFYAKHNAAGRGIARLGKEGKALRTLEENAQVAAVEYAKAAETRLAGRVKALNEDASLAHATKNSPDGGGIGTERDALYLKPGVADIYAKRYRERFLSKDVIDRAEENRAKAKREALAAKETGWAGKTLKSVMRRNAQLDAYLVKNAGGEQGKRLVKAMIFATIGSVGALAIGPATTTAFATMWGIRVARSVTGMAGGTIIGQGVGSLYEKVVGQGAAAKLADDRNRSVDSAEGLAKMRTNYRWGTKESIARQRTAVQMVTSLFAGAGLSWGTAEAFHFAGIGTPEIPNAGPKAPPEAPKMAPEAISARLPGADLDKQFGLAHEPHGAMPGGPPNTIPGGLAQAENAGKAIDLAETPRVPSMAASEYAHQPEITPPTEGSVTPEEIQSTIDRWEQGSTMPKVVLDPQYQNVLKGWIELHPGQHIPADLSPDQATADVEKAISSGTVHPVPETHEAELNVDAAAAHGGEGSIRLFEHLKHELRAHLQETGADKTHLTEAQREILDEDPTKLAIKYHFYDPKNPLESSKIADGDTLGFNDQGKLVFGHGNQVSEINKDNLYSGPMGHNPVPTLPEHPPVPVPKPEDVSTADVINHDLASSDTIGHPHAEIPITEPATHTPTPLGGAHPTDGAGVDHLATAQTAPAAPAEAAPAGPVMPHTVAETLSFAQSHAAEAHIYADQGGKHLFVWGGTPQTQQATIGEFASRHPELKAGTLIYGTDNEGKYMIPYTKMPDGSIQITAAPVRSDGILGFFKSFVKAPDPKLNKFESLLQ